MLYPPVADMLKYVDSRYLLVAKKKAPFERCCLPSVFWVLLEHGYLIIHGMPMK